jgi:hypothetical protein
MPIHIWASAPAVDDESSFYHHKLNYIKIYKYTSNFECEMPKKYQPTFVCAIVEVAPGKYEVANIREIRPPKDKKPDYHYRYPHNMYLLVGTQLDFGSLKAFKGHIERKISKLEQELEMGPSMEDIMDKLDEFPQVYQTIDIQFSEHRQLETLDFSMKKVYIPTETEIEPTAELMLN